MSAQDPKERIDTGDTLAAYTTEMENIKALHATTPLGDGISLKWWARVGWLIQRVEELDALSYHLVKGGKARWNNERKTWEIAT